MFSDESPLPRQRTAARLLQYLCITVLYQIVGIEFCFLLPKMKTYVGEKLEKKKSQTNSRIVKSWTELLPYYENALRNVFYFEVFSHAMEQAESRNSYQIDYGYRLYTRYWQVMQECEPTRELTLARQVEGYKKRKWTEEELTNKVCLVLHFVVFLFARRLLISLLLCIV